MKQLLILLSCINIFGSTILFAQNPVNVSTYLSMGGTMVICENKTQISKVLKSKTYSDECFLYFENHTILNNQIIKLLNQHPKVNIYVDGIIDSIFINRVNQIKYINNLEVNLNSSNSRSFNILPLLNTYENLILDVTETPTSLPSINTLNFKSLSFSGHYGNDLFKQLYSNNNLNDLKHLELNFTPPTNLQTFKNLETITLNLANTHNTDVEYYTRNLKNNLTGNLLQATIISNDTLSKLGIESIFNSFKNYTEISETLEKNQDYTKIINNPHVQPPIKGLETEFETFEVLANQGLTEFVTKNGTKITLPANALIDKNGNPFKGNFTLLYREYKTGLDAFLGGIPMVYANNGDTNTFETNGMFEIQAIANGQSLSLKENATINIEMEGAKADTGFDFFELDTTGNWKKIAPSSSINPISKAQNNTQVTRQIGRYYLIDTLSFESKYRSLKYSVYEDRLPAFSDQITYRFFHLNYYESPNRKGRTGYKLHPRTRNFRIRLLPKRQRDDQELRIQLAIDPNAVKIFKEYKAFNNTVWVLKENCGRQLFKERYKQNKIYKDFRILYNNNDNSCVLEFKTLQGFIQLEVDLAQTMAQNKMSLRRFKNHYNRYQRILNNKRDRYNKTVKRRKKNPFIYRYIQLDTLNPNSINLAPNQFLYSLGVSRFGIYNCDRIRILESRIAVKPQLLDSSNLRIHPEMYYVFYPELNMVYSLTQNSFYIDPNVAAYIMVIDKQNNMWCYTRNQIKNTQWSVGATVPLMLSRFNQNIHTVGDLMTIINSKTE